MKDSFPYDHKDAAVREFKEILHHQVVLMRNATLSQSVYIFWVNREREQFVLEAGTTTSHSVMFPDRIPFADCFLHPYKDLSHVRNLRVGSDIAPQQCTHHLGPVTVQTMTIIPFLNQGETVALTVLEHTEDDAQGTDHAELYNAYRSTFRNLLSNYLQRTSNLETAGEWERYETSLNRIDSNKHQADILSDLIDEMEVWAPGASVHLVLKTGNRWISILHNSNAPHAGFTGIEVEERSMASVALERGETQFAIHFNQNPKILSSREQHTSGASYLIPLTIFGQRQGVIVVNHIDPLALTESAKHKLSNLVRVASLHIEAGTRKPAGEPLFTSGPGCIIPNLWERSIETAWHRATKVAASYTAASHPAAPNTTVPNTAVSRQGLSSTSGHQKPTQTEYTYFGVATIENIRELQTRHRLETLRELQKECAEYLEPTRYGFRGYVGFRSDYIFPVILFSHQPQTPTEWSERVQQPSDSLASLRIRVVPVTSEYEDPYDIIREGLR